MGRLMCVFGVATPACLWEQVACLLLQCLLSQIASPTLRGFGFNRHGGSDREKRRVKNHEGVVLALTAQVVLMSFMYDPDVYYLWLCGKDVLDEITPAPGERYRALQCSGLCAPSLGN